MCFMTLGKHNDSEALANKCLDIINLELEEFS